MPAVVGVQMTSIVALPPAGMVVGSVPVKTPPVNIGAAMVRSTSPVLYSVIVFVKSDPRTTLSKIIGDAIGLSSG